MIALTLASAAAAGPTEDLTAAVEAYGKGALQSRDGAAARLTPDQLITAQKSARDWRPN